MEVLDKILGKLKKKPKPVTIVITDINTKSCGNCIHHRKDPGSFIHKCMHFPAAEITEVNIKYCKIDERKHWSPKKNGVITRFFNWLF